MWQKFKVAASKTDGELRDQLLERLTIEEIGKLGLVYVKETLYVASPQPWSAAAVRVGRHLEVSRLTEKEKKRAPAAQGPAQMDIGYINNDG